MVRFDLNEQLVQALSADLTVISTRAASRLPALSERDVRFLSLPMDSVWRHLRVIKATACSMAAQWNHLSWSHSSDDQPDAREGQAGRPGVAERFDMEHCCASRDGHCTLASQIHLMRARNVEIKPDEYLRIECYPAKMGKNS